MDTPETKIANIGEMVMSDKPTVILSVPNLGSCLGIIAWDPKRKLGAACHCLLPMSKTNPEKAANQPFSFVDTGFCSLLEMLIKAGCNPKDLKIVVAGGSNMNDPDNVFQIGQKNITILRKLLWKNNLLMIYLKFLVFDFHKKI